MSDERREGMTMLAMRVDGIEKTLASMKGNQEAFVARHEELAQQLKDNTELTKKVEANTAGVVDMFSALQGGFKVLGVLGQIGKWIAYIAGAVTAVWAVLHVGNGIRPK